MSRLGPVITLAVGAVLAAGLGVASITATPAADDTVVTANDTPAQESTPEPSATPTFEESAPAAPRKADYAGRVKGNGGLIAISVRDGKAIGYFCDGKTEAWFKGDATGPELTLEGFGKATVEAELGGGKAAGEVAVGGRKWTFEAPVAKKPSGLYRASAIVRGAKIRAGWIVLRNPQGGFTQVGTAFQDDEQVPTPKLDGDAPTSPVTVNGTTVTPEDVDGFIEEMR
ncbi:hypothetical protein [Nonomuraea sp. SBT364]|uniref:hypothetical protein n=1 Tax=Nonomuraea sp. SBT364 TaxID=1580530 RepID=UPI0007C7B29B|nr:hypothetical protein [Nonomuraea sp. SBT364]